MTSTLTHEEINAYKIDYEKSGYVIIDTYLEEHVLEGAKEDLNSFFGDQRQQPKGVPFADYNRIQDAWYISQNVRRIAQAPAVLQLLGQLYEAPVRPFQTLNFYQGTVQPVHADSIHFNSEPFGNMCGVWVALEDIGPDQGALIYYPGSHHLPEMNYDYFGLRSTEESYQAYLQGLAEIIAQYEYPLELGLIRKGQAIVWSANLLHGGSKRNNRELTRHSQVTHYYVDNKKTRYWRPSQSIKKRAYFRPDWVRDVTGEEPIDFSKRAMADTKPSLIRRVTNKILKLIAVD